MLFLAALSLELCVPAASTSKAVVVLSHESALLAAWARPL